MANYYHSSNHKNHVAMSDADLLLLMMKLFSVQALSKASEHDF